MRPRAVEGPPTLSAAGSGAAAVHTRRDRFWVDVPRKLAYIERHGLTFEQVAALADDIDRRFLAGDLRVFDEYDFIRPSVSGDDGQDDAPDDTT